MSIFKKIFSIERDATHKHVRIFGFRFSYMHREAREKGYKALMSLMEIDPALLHQIARSKGLPKLLKAMNLPYINRDEVISKCENMKERGVSSVPRSSRIIVSLTSYPARMYDIHLSLYSLLSQDMKPDKVILWLADEQFPNRENDIPKKVLALKDWGLEIRWCPDYRSYKKLIPALQEFPDDFIITADDDLYYPVDWVRNLWTAYEKGNKHVLYAHRCHKIAVKGNKVLPYGKWQRSIIKTKPSFANFPTSGGGVLYAPGCLHPDVTDVTKARALCPYADDIWFWGMSVLAGSKITVIDDNPYKDVVVTNIIRQVGLNSDGTLFAGNATGGNDEQLANLFKAYPEIRKRVLESVK